MSPLDGCQWLCLQGHPSLVSDRDDREDIADDVVDDGGSANVAAWERSSGMSAISAWITSATVTTQSPASGLTGPVGVRHPATAATTIASVAVGAHG